MRIWLRGIGLAVVCVAAVVASFSTLAALAEFTGWGSTASWLLPASLDALGMTACLVWLDAAAPKKARRWAAWMTWVAAGLSIVGNGVGHLASTGHLEQDLWLVLLVGAVPPAALATTVHLIVLVSAPGKSAAKVRDAAPVPATEQQAAPTPSPAKKAAAPKPPSPKSPVKSGPESGPVLDEVLMQRGRHLWDRYAAEGKHVTRDALKTELEIGTGKATPLLAALKKEKEVA
jgi:hypothetical protein